MSNDLISREALKKLLEEDLQSGGTKTDEFDKGYDLGIEKAIEMLDNAPTVEPKQGEWIKIGEIGLAYKCNRCGEVAVVPTNFCSHCGADMRGVESHLDNTPTAVINKDFYKTDKSNPINRSDLFQ